MSSLCPVLGMDIPLIADNVFEKHWRPCQQVVRLGAEIQDLEGVLADVADKVAELEEAERTAVGGKHDITAMIGQVLFSTVFLIRITEFLTLEVCHKFKPWAPVSERDRRGAGRLLGLRCRRSRPLLAALVRAGAPP